MHAILAIFAEHYEVHQIGLNYHGDPHPYPWHIYPASSGGDVYGIGRAADLVGRIQPDVIFVVNDPWVANQTLERIRSCCAEALVVVYTPVDSGPIDPSFVTSFDVAHHIVTYTDFGARMIDEAIEWAIKLAERPWRRPSFSTIPHGVDTAIFCPLDQSDDGRRVLDTIGVQNSRLAAKQAMLPDLGDPESSFVVLNANRNQPRKRIDLTMDAFARFARGKPDNVLLYLHMGLEDAGWNIPRLADHFGIADRLVISSRSSLIPGLPDSHLNLIYNACDVGINTATGEGWGLVAFEHAAARGAQIMTAHDTAIELWEGAASLVPHSHTAINPGISTEAKIADAADLAAALEALYADRGRLHELQDAGYRRATSPELQWPGIAARFMHLFEQTPDQDKTNA
jgi:D-inositol-3-phosphate glycosyltransferase